MISIALRTASGLNNREYYRERARRVKAERNHVAWALVGRRIEPPKLPCVVTLTRVAPSNGLDSGALGRGD